MKKWIVRSLLASAVTCGISFLLLNDYYARSLPREPNPATGQIYVQVAGFSPKAMVYLTSRQSATFYILMGASIVPALVAGALNASWKVFPKLKQGL